MRNIKKKLKVRTVVCSVYDRAEKIERTFATDLPETSDAPTLPANCVLLDMSATGEREVTYTMTPAEFVAHATPEAPAAPAAPQQ